MMKRPADWFRVLFAVSKGSNSSFETKTQLRSPRIRPEIQKIRASVKSESHQKHWFLRSFARFQNKRQCRKFL
jgi:hypothetical protein